MLKFLFTLSYKYNGSEMSGSRVGRYHTVGCFKSFQLELLHKVVFLCHIES